MRIEKAYLKAITSEAGFRVGLERQSVLNARVQARKGKFPMIEVMHKRLKAAGWKRVQEEDWTK